MRQIRPSVLLLVFAGACATTSSGKPVATETTSASSTSSLVVGSSAMGTMNIGTTNSYTAVSVSVPVSPDSAFQVLSRAYSMLEIPVAPVSTKRAVGNDEIKIRRRIAGIPMQNVLDCGEKMGLPNAETWDIHMNLLSYIQPAQGGGSQVFTRIQAMGNPTDLSNRDLTPCSTKGELEKKIGDLVLKLVNNK
ncbi:MAG TPA: hypothetical protein VGQ30_14440 [Gemmatimonadaceae bacterium]|jgi:hypothetical protein|nr:hypothetical protein [Gemmatimonadaceae bacterium]